MIVSTALNARPAIRAALLACSLLLGACAGAGPGAGSAPQAAAATAPAAAGQPARPSAPAALPATAPVSVAPSATATAGEPSTPTTPAAAPRPNTGAGPASPVEPAAGGALPAIGALDLSCKTAADCSIKDVGSCCGYQPRCLNRASPTYAEQVKARCAAEGRVSHCGMPTVTGCECLAGKCANLGSTDAGLVR